MQDKARIRRTISEARRLAKREVNIFAFVSMVDTLHSSFVRLLFFFQRKDLYEHDFDSSSTRVLSQRALQPIRNEYTCAVINL
jgi:hypothetical protein